MISSFVCLKPKTLPQLMIGKFHLFIYFYFYIFFTVVWFAGFLHQNRPSKTFFLLTEEFHSLIYWFSSQEKSKASVFQPIHHDGDFKAAQHSRYEGVVYLQSSNIFDNSMKHFFPLGKTMKVHLSVPRGGEGLPDSGEHIFSDNCSGERPLWR